MTGGAGNDTFVWKAGDQGTTGLPALDTVTGFGNGNDTLNLADLLQGEHAFGSAANLVNYLHFVPSNDGLDTTIEIRSSGTGTLPDQKIVLVGVADLTLGGTVSDSAIITNLLLQGKLQTDT